MKLQIFKESLDALEQAGGNCQQAGWLRWEDVRDGEASTVDVMDVRQRPPYDYGDLSELIKAIR